MDIVTILGIFLGIGGLLIAFILDGGDPTALIEPTAAMIVFGGTFGATMISFSGSVIKRFPVLVKMVFVHKQENRQEVMNKLLELAQVARKEGLLSLESVIETSTDDDFIKNGIRLVVDGVDPEGLQHTLETRIQNMEERHEEGIAMFEAMGGFGPTMGVLGTVMGMVHVLGNMTDAASLGPKIAIAFIATMYGVSSANILWLPFASKLKQINKEEVLTKYMMLEGIMMIQNGSNPTYMKEQLKGYLDHAPEETQESGE